ncbi:hypothetical protein DUI87_02908 [Hirundo rustica rustica]|uniref:Uncharacterized protein n=1 Tax=Hirundo rustica rustica TaxID=333673 RepID=A0A3M0LSP8_HIRRU|nr:hypothetical protein DUI87_02908 [Hirundo rustica rustica]
MRLLGQLHEMETAFDGFWEKHQLKMEQYLQLWKFEQSFQEVKNAIEFLMGQQAELPDTGYSNPQVKQRLKDLDHFDGMAQCQIQFVQAKLENVCSMFENRQSCFKKLLVAPRPENPPRSKSPLFSPKHGEGSSIPPDTQSGVKPTDTQSEAEATDDTQSEAKPTNTKSEAQPTGTRSRVQSTATRSGARPTATRSGATIESFSLKDLRGLRKDYTRRPDESIISWLVHPWDAAGEATMLDGTEARHLSSLSHDPVIDQEMMREARPCSLWETGPGKCGTKISVCDDLYMQQTQWKTIKQGIQRLEEMAVAEIVFSDNINTKNPDLVPCTPVM